MKQPGGEAIAQITLCTLVHPPPPTETFPCTWPSVQVVPIFLEMSNCLIFMQILSVKERFCTVYHIKGSEGGG